MKTSINRILFALSVLASAAFASPGTKTEEFVYPPEVKGIIDVTKAPYFADNTGGRDCTEALIRAMDDSLREDHEAMKETVTNLKGEKKDVFEANTLSFAERQRILAANPQAIIGSERCRGTFPYKNPATRILYFPNGTYLVSDTVVYSFTDQRNAGGVELNRCLHFQGQSETGTVIRLKDHADGFGAGTEKPVISFTRGRISNVAMQNTFENFTILVGRGNPGAIGVEFFANNTGAIRDVTVRSLDPELAGRAGLAMRTINFSGVLVKNLTVDGFDYGVEVLHHRLFAAFEHIKVSNQRVAGFFVEDNNVSLRGLISSNRVPAVCLKGQPATLALVDSDFSGGGTSTAAIQCTDGYLFARNIKTSGYSAAIERNGQTVVSEPNVNEYVSHSVSTLFQDQKKQSLDLPVEETPEIPWDKDFQQWAGTDQFGARGDGLTDDTEAIQRAMNSGKSTIYFQPGTYLINGSIDVPASVRRIDMMYCDLVAGGDLQTMTNSGAFRIREGSDPLVIENLYAFELFFGAHYFIDHASTRTLVLKDIHTQFCAMYRNSVPGGKVFLENTAATNPLEQNPHCFAFYGQKVWARQLNPERANPEVLNDGSSLWVLGFKTERGGCAFQTTHGGRTEILNGTFNLWRHKKDTSPAIINDNSSVSVVASTTGKDMPPYPYVLVEEVRDGQTNRLPWIELPRRNNDLVVLPLYVGQKNK